MDPQRLQAFLTCLPDWFRNYAALHMDTLPKFINHVLVLMAFCNVVLFFSSWTVPVLPDVGLNATLISFLLFAQNICLFLIFNNSQLEDNANVSIRFLAPTEFMIGNALGITIGACLLAFVLSGYYRNLSRCVHVRTQIQEEICALDNGRGSLASFSFWARVIFWLEFCLSLLISIGRNQLATDNGRSREYENLSLDEHDDQFRRYGNNQQQQQQQQQQYSGAGGAAAAGAGGGIGGIIGTFAGALPGNSFAGNYSNVPEINNSQERSNSNNTNVNTNSYGNNDASSSSSSSHPTIKTPLDPA